jgi:hypothetical protein
VKTSRLTEQIKTRPITTQAILRDPAFRRGLADVRAGRPFNPDDDHSCWHYGRGRQFGALVPLDFPLFNDDGSLSPVAIEVFDAAYSRRWII